MRKMKAVSPIVATAMLILIAIVGSAFLYLWVTKSTTNAKKSAEVAVKLASMEPNDTNSAILTISVKNIGGATVKLTNVSLSCPNTAKTFFVTLDEARVVSNTGPGSEATVTAKVNLNTACGITWDQLLDYGYMNGKLPLYSADGTKYLGFATFTAEASG
jgi:flagellin-like protein